MRTIHYELSQAHREQLFAFYFAQWWCAGRTREQAERALAASYVVVVCDESDRLVGFARMLSDGALFAWLGDVTVRPELRGTGLGATVVEAALAHPALRAVGKWDLTCVPDMDAFYARWGFADPAPSLAHAAPDAPLTRDAAEAPTDIRLGIFRLTPAARPANTGRMPADLPRGTCCRSDTPHRPTA